MPFKANAALLLLLSSSLTSSTGAEEERRLRSGVLSSDQAAAATLVRIDAHGLTLPLPNGRSISLNPHELSAVDGTTYVSKTKDDEDESDISFANFDQREDPDQPDLQQRDPPHHRTTTVLSKLHGSLERAMSIDIETGEQMHVSHLAGEDYKLNIVSVDDYEDSEEIKESGSYVYNDITDTVDFIEDQDDGDDDEDSNGVGSSRRPSMISLSTAATCSSMRVLRLAMRYDSGYCALHDDDQEKAEAYVNYVMELANSLFLETQLCVSVRACSLKGFCNGSDGKDPYREMYEGGEAKSMCNGREDDLLQVFRKLSWPDTVFDDTEKCDGTHLVYGPNSAGKRPIHSRASIGCAFIGGSCTGFSVGISYFGFTGDNDPVKYFENPSLHASLLAHEITHNLGANHAPNGRSELMQKHVCSTCTNISEDTREEVESNLSIKRAKSLRRGRECMLEEDIPEPGPGFIVAPPNKNLPAASPTTAPSESPSASPTETNEYGIGGSGDSLCAPIDNRKECNLEATESCTWLNDSKTCQRRDETECHEFNRNNCRPHSDGRCRWESSSDGCVVK